MNRSKHVCIIEFDRTLCVRGDARPKYLNANTREKLILLFFKVFFIF